MAAGPVIFGEVRLDDDGRIDEAVACLHCGRELGGEFPDGECPGCKKPVEDSIRSDLLRFQSPTWLNRLMLGVGIVMFGVGLATTLGIIKMLAWWEVIPMNTLLSFWGYALQMSPIVVTAGGLWLATSRQPMDFTPEPLWSLRRIAQWSAAAAAALVILMVLADGLKSNWGAMQGLRMSVRLPWQSLIHLSWLFAAACGFQVTVQLAQRSPDARLARLMGWSSWVVILSLGAVYFFADMSPLIAFRYKPSNTLADEALPALYAAWIYTGYTVYLLALPAALWTCAMAGWLLRRIYAASRRYAWATQVR